MTHPIWNGLDTYLRNRSDVDERGCWVWRQSCVTRGYAQGCYQGREIACHRAALEWKLGRRLERGECACHACDVPRCVNPDHLWVGSHRDNMRDMQTKLRASKLDPVRLQQLMEQGLAKSAIARELGVDPRTIFRYLSRRTQIL